MRISTKIAAAASAAALSLSLVACSGGATTSTSGATGDAGAAASGTVSYWLWDANQLPAYKACADAFTQANPSIKVEVTQSG